MKKYNLLHLCLLAGFLLSTSNIFSQGKKIGLLVGGNFLYSNPKGSFGNDFKSGAGAEIMGGLGLGKTFLVVNSGRSYYFGKAGVENLSVKPFKIGLRQYFLGKRVFINADLGRATIKDRSKETSEIHNLRGFGAGARLFGLEAAVNYEGWDNTGINGFSNSLQYKLGWNFML